MSVQIGILSFDGEPIGCESLTRLSSTAAAYGPDGETTHCQGPVGFLYRPFRTTAEATAEHQPVVSPQGNIVTWDGRLDNRHELIEQLQDTLRSDTTDAEIAATAFDRWCTDCFTRIVGDWAISIWIPDNRELILARDYMGIRHLFYHLTPTRVTWSSHLASLAIANKNLHVCDRYIAGYLAADPEADLTPYQEIRAVPPGHFVRIKSGKVTFGRFWSADLRPSIHYRSDAEYEEHYRYLFRQAVQRRLRTQSRILADLSGGLDSTSIVCMADSILNTSSPGTPGVDTFSFYDLAEPDEDDFRYITKVEQLRGRAGFCFNFEGGVDSILFDRPVFVASPSFGGRAEITTALSQVLEQHEYRVSLSGRGGDEFNGQALNLRVQMADLFLQLRFVELAKQLAAWSLLIRKRPWVHLLAQSLLQLAPGWTRALLTDEGKVDPWINPAFARRYQVSIRQVDATRGLGVVYPSVRDAVHTIVTIGRQMSSLEPSIVETRYPYLDQQLVEFLTAIPLDQLLRPGQRRFLMRRALANIVPQDILLRRTKSMVSRCFAVTLEVHWKLVESLFCHPVGSRLGYFVTEPLRESLRAVKNGQSSPYVLRLMKAISLETWLRQAESYGVISISRGSAI
jgi:asparagine synthase (glutamine-hydrolysing)